MLSEYAGIKVPQKLSFNAFARRVKRVVCTFFSVQMQLSCLPVMSSCALLRIEVSFIGIKKLIGLV